METLNFASKTQLLKCDNSLFGRAVNTCGHYVLLVFLFCLSSTLVTFGVVYLHQCEIAEFIPLYLLILGVYGIVEQIVYFIYNDNSEHPTPTLWILSRSFIIGLFVWGSVEFYNLETPNYDSSKGPHCNKTLYLFTYWVNTIAWIIIVLITVVSCMIITICNCKSLLFKRNQVLLV